MVNCFSDLAIGRVERDIARRSRAPSGRHWREASPCCRAVLRASRVANSKFGPSTMASTGTSLLAKSAIDAFHHVDVIARGAPRAVIAARTGLDGDRLGRTDGLAQFAGDAALFPVGIAPQRVLAAKPRRNAGSSRRDSSIVGLGRKKVSHAQRQSPQMNSARNKAARRLAQFHVEFRLRHQFSIRRKAVAEQRFAEQKSQDRQCHQSLQPDQVHDDGRVDAMRPRYFLAFMAASHRWIDSSGLSA